MTTCLSAFFGKDKDQAFFFSGDQYIRYDKPADRADQGYPLPVRGNWPGLTFDSVDAVINWGNGVAYFFKGDRYIRYLVKQAKLDRNAGMPQQLFELNWALMPQSDDAKNEAVGRPKDLLGAAGGLPGLLVNEIIDTFAKKLGGGGGRRPSWHSLEQLSRQANATLRDFVTANEGKKINFLSVDFFQNARAVELAVNLCRQRSAEAAAAGVS